LGVCGFNPPTHIHWLGCVLKKGVVSMSSSSCGLVFWSWALWRACRGGVWGQGKRTGQQCVLQK
jgi:hypothetical protein